MARLSMLSRSSGFSYISKRPCPPRIFIRARLLPSSRRSASTASTNKMLTFSWSGALIGMGAWGGVMALLALERRIKRTTLAEEPASNFTPNMLERGDSASSDSSVGKRGGSSASTLPLMDVGPIIYDLSGPNLHGAYNDFVALLGEENVDVRHGELVSRSSTSWSPAPNGELDIPSVIVFPRHTEDVSNIAKICHSRRIPMIAFSGGTSLEGTLAAQHKEVCVDFNRHMNKIVEIRKDDMDVTVQPAVGYMELNQILEAEGLFFPVDPGPGAQIGGMISQGCSGTNAYRYGTMKDWVLGLEVVLADGTIIKTRGRPRKSSAGFDLTRLFTGSEGTLGFITEAHIKITRAPQNLRIAVAQFPTVGDAVKMAVKVLQSGHQLEAMELLDELTMHGVNEGGYCTASWDEKPTLFLKLAGPSPEFVAETANTVEGFAKACGTTLFRLAQTAEEGDEIWHARKTALWSTIALKKDPSDVFISSDPCVPISQLPEIVKRSQELIAEAGVLGNVLGHVGDGNIHTSVLYGAGEKEAAMRIMSEVQRLAADLDGTVSGEHGLGLGYRHQLAYELGEESVDAMRRIKFALDPLCLMNPGKMITVE
ncbi:D-lactate dehydrogenase [Neohortaea acidophila]|uniref:D-lactate dehydrogenase (cytochrome) n=1 Tax=Neohortaea acidophila TaxID=245834 RepID=A0A6A6PQR9_9PEZI|nr:D-lactate dehydrogenase [Neohortaea acidophila]KAF2482458.1 D-lactate dehydrogenase [Neohortaea acidophila]